MLELHISADDCFNDNNILCYYYFSPIAHRTKNFLIMFFFLFFFQKILVVVTIVKIIIKVIIK